MSSDQYSTAPSDTIPQSLLANYRRIRFQASLDDSDGSWAMTNNTGDPNSGDMSVFLDGIGSRFPSTLYPGNLRDGLTENYDESRKTADFNQGGKSTTGDDLWDELASMHAPSDPWTWSTRTVTSLESNMLGASDSVNVAVPSSLHKTPNTSSMAPALGTALGSLDPNDDGMTGVRAQVDNGLNGPVPGQLILPRKKEGTGSCSTETGQYDRPQESRIGARHVDLHTRRPRQVGIATIRIESVSLARQHTVDTDNSCRPSKHSSALSTTEDDLSSVGDSETVRDDAEDSNRSKDKATSESSAMARPPRLPAQSRTGAEDGQKSEDDDVQEERGPKRRRVGSPTPSTSRKPMLHRFACPYQAFEQGLPCLRRSRRNPEGGSDGLARLKYEPFCIIKKPMCGD